MTFKNEIHLTKGDIVDAILKYVAVKAPTAEFNASDIKFTFNQTELMGDTVITLDSAIIPYTMR